MAEKSEGEVIRRESDEDPAAVAVEYRLPANRFLSDEPLPHPWLCQFVGRSDAQAKNVLHAYWRDLFASELVQLREKLLGANEFLSLVVFSDLQAVCLSNDTGQDPDWFSWCPWLLPAPPDFHDYEAKLDEFGLRNNALAVEMIRFFGGLRRNPFFVCDLLPPWNWDAFSRDWLRNFERHAYWEGALALYSQNGNTLLLNSRGETAWWFPCEEVVIQSGPLNEFVIDYLVGDRMAQPP